MEPATILALAEVGRYLARSKWRDAYSIRTSSCWGVLAAVTAARQRHHEDAIRHRYCSEFGWLNSVAIVRNFLRMDGQDIDASPICVKSVQTSNIRALPRRQHLFRAPGTRL